jgi:hypothetical protein
MRTTQLALTAALLGSACLSGGGYVSTGVVYAEPVEYVYVVPMDRVVVVSRDVLSSHGWVVYRVQRSGGGRILWARRGPDEVIRVFATPRGNRVVLRGVREVRVKDRGRHRGWERRDAPRSIIAAIDVRLRRR